MQTKGNESGIEYLNEYFESMLYSSRLQRTLLAMLKNEDHWTIRRAMPMDRDDDDPQALGRCTTTILSVGFPGCWVGWSVGYSTCNVQKYNALLLGHTKRRARTFFAIFLFLFVSSRVLHLQFASVYDVQVSRLSIPSTNHSSKPRIAIIITTIIQDS